MMQGLFLVPTPIGNLEDITLRSIRILSQSRCILAEDTRVSGKLLHHLKIRTPLKSYHDHNKERVTQKYIEELKEGNAVSLITDAGTPGIADPAFFIVREALAQNIPVIPLPGPTAFVPALICSGLPTDRFIFENFLPPKSSKRKRFFQSLKDEKRTVIFYESPHRIEKVVKELAMILPHASIAIGREISKIHEEFLRGTPLSIADILSHRKLKGEIVVMINTDFKDTRSVFS
ncbi:MAG: 16S rRNA (cytidine(1402)-2'-O)-methyltransferase [Fibrobacterota bacterium]